jgi:hypothetical protein
MTTQQTVRAFAQVRAKKQQHLIGQKITTSIFGREVTGIILAVHPFNTVDIELPSGRCYRVSGLPALTNQE